MGLTRTDCRHAAAVTKDDTKHLECASFIYVGGDGNVNVYTAAHETVLFVGMSAGDILPVLCVKVMSTSTTATNMVAIW